MVKLRKEQEAAIGRKRYGSPLWFLNRRQDGNLASDEIQETNGRPPIRARQGNEVDAIFRDRECPVLVSGMISSSSLPSSFERRRLHDSLVLRL